MAAWRDIIAMDNLTHKKWKVNHIVNLSYLVSSIGCLYACICLDVYLIAMCVYIYMQCLNCRIHRPLEFVHLFHLHILNDSTYWDAPPSQ